MGLKTMDFMKLKYHTYNQINQYLKGEQNIYLKKQHQ